MAASKTEKHAFIEATPKNFRQGNSIKPKKDLTAVVRWPKCVQLQRKRAVLLRKLKIPPALFQFQTTLNRNEAFQLFKLLAKYRPETSIEEKERLIKAAVDRMAEGKSDTPAPPKLVSGLDEVTKLVEMKRALLVVIAHDVNPVELVCWLPTLCRKMQVPYCIVKGKGRLGTLVYRKNAAVLALEQVNPADRTELQTLVSSFAGTFIDNADARRKWGN